MSCTPGLPDHDIHPRVSCPRLPTGPKKNSYLEQKNDVVSSKTASMTFLCPDSSMYDKAACEKEMLTGENLEQKKGRCSLKNCLDDLSLIAIRMYDKAAYAKKMLTGEIISFIVDEKSDANHTKPL